MHKVPTKKGGFGMRILSRKPVHVAAQRNNRNLYVHPCSAKSCTG